jgi:hypothetical protein
LHEVFHPRAGMTARESDFVEYAPALFVRLSRSEQKAIQNLYAKALRRALRRVGSRGRGHVTS